MAKSSLHLLSWSEEHQHYELHTQGRLDHYFRPEDEQKWQAWISLHTSFAFQEQQGHLSVIKETRARGTGYWYAYRTQQQRVSKRYLGATVRVTLARLKEEALALTHPGTSPQVLQRASIQEKPQEAAPIPQVENVLKAALDRSSPSLPTTLAQQNSLVLASKLSPPRLPATLVERASLLTRLEAALTHPLTLLSASAGWGKTTLLSAWVAHTPHAVVWLSLDASDNDPTRFWGSVLAALRARHPGLGATASALLQNPQAPPLALILTTLLSELANLARQTVLILDDYHSIEEQAIHESVLFLLERLPESLRLVLASRIDPPLPLSRLRVRGQISEIRDTDLRFHQEDVEQFLRKATGLLLSAEMVGVLEARTEGWIAGLQLASLALQQREDHAAFIQTFNGSHRYLLDYVQEDILARLPEALHDFLLQSAVLSRLNASVCQAVTAAASIQESQEMLEQVERSNLFLVPLDEERHWYRFHDLFREALLARLRATQPELMLLLHQRAASWYEEQNELREAIAHLLACGDFSAAARVMERAAEETWLQGETQTLSRWLMALPDAVVRDHAHLALISALYLLNSSASLAEAQQSKARLQVERIVVRVEDMLRQQDHENRPSEETTFLQERLRLLRAYMVALDAIMVGNVERLRASSLAMPHVESETEIIWQMISLSVHFILHFTFLREGGLLVPWLQEMKQRVSQDGNRYATIKVRQWLALAYESAGQLHLAYQECLAAQALLQQLEGHAILAGYFSVCLTDVLYHWNRLEEGHALASRLIQDAATWQQVDLERAGYRQSAEYALAAGNLAGAQQALQKMECLLQREQWTASYVSWLEMFRVRYWLATGNLAAANDWAARVVFRVEQWDPKRKGEFLMLIRVYCAQQHYDQAIEILERFSKYFEQPGELWATCAFLAVFTIALYHGGKSERARAVLIRLLQMTEPEGFIRVYLDEGESMCQALQALLDMPRAQDQDVSPVLATFILTLLTAFEQEQAKHAVPATSLSAGTATPPSLPPKGPSAQAVLHESLSSQELRVLHLLVAGQTYAEIAETLIVSLNTIKTQVQSIYRKLDVSRRAEASAVAQRLHLL